MPDKNLVNSDMFDLYGSFHNNYMWFNLKIISPPSRVQSFSVFFHIIFLPSVCLCNVSIIRIMHI